MVMDDCDSERQDGGQKGGVHISIFKRKGLVIVPIFEMNSA